MLYERWRGIAAARSAATALHDHSTARQWTFAELFRAAEKAPPPSVRIIHPQGCCASFVIDVLRGWRANAVVCPLESGQAPPLVSIPPPPCVHLKTTSATAGTPRTVAFTAEQLAADAENIVATMGLRTDWPNLGTISMAHSYGFSNLVLPLLLHGIPLIIVPAPLPEAIRRASGGQFALTVPAVPALWRAWHEAGAIPANIRLAISAGAPLPIDLEKAVFEDLGIKIHNFYGSTECGGIAYDNTLVPRRDETCVGAPMRNVTLSLNQGGCLYVDSRAAGDSYWPEPTSDLGHGRFQTGDLAELKDGLVYLRGRITDLINIAGRKVSPDQIEQALRTHSAIRECVVFGVPERESDRTELIVGCVAATEPLTGEQLRQHLLATLPAWQVPRDWWFTESLPANQRGKISRAEWRARYLQTQRGGS